MIMWKVKNPKHYKLKQKMTICMEFDEFKRMVEDLTDGLKTVVCDFEGMFYEDTNKAYDVDEYWNKHIHETIGEYFGINVSTIHTDGCEYAMVWIVYEEQSAKKMK